MKKQILLLIITLAAGIFCKTNAQGTLQFNRVVLTELSGLDNVRTVATSTLTVDADKVLKVEYISYSTIHVIDGLKSGGSVKLFIDNMNLGNGTAGLFPVWLPAGTYTLKLIQDNSPSNDGHIFIGFLSALEFNVIP